MKIIPQYVYLYLLVVIGNKICAIRYNGKFSALFFLLRAFLNIVTFSQF